MYTRAGSACSRAVVAMKAAPNVGLAALEQARRGSDAPPRGGAAAPPFYETQTGPSPFGDGPVLFLGEVVPVVLTFAAGRSVVRWPC